MQAIILAAGLGTRTYPLTLTRPKPLLKVANKTIIEHNLEQLKGLVEEVIIVIGYKGEMIKKLIGKSFNKLKITYVLQKQQLGSGHALELCKNKLKDSFIVMNGDDIFCKEDIERCLKHKYCILAKKVENPYIFGILKVKGKYVLEIIEKPKKYLSALANTGLYRLDKDIFNIKLKKTARQEYEITDYINELAKENNVSFIKAKEYWFPVSYPWSLLNANEFFINKINKNEIKGKVESNVIIKDKIIVGKGTTIKSGSCIEGPVIIGENCEIGPNSYLRKGATIGNNCKIGNACEIKNSILMDNTKVPHLSYVADSIIGENCNLGAGTIIANLRHDKENVKSKVKNELIDTGRRKFGAVIGDNVHTGINTSIYPGRKLWPGMNTVPGEVVRKDITE
ncbi:glucose-1-phosphate thymidylyltransferase [Candidatus Woesearchaeota archaeon]|nr:glucose-1-phosphate thymidylyltransferase [Candidatus Woesearchaeota archaeon]|tara:strand:- start:30127 stop:31314 length:1188 start_codon:yes stop_codon:yes gene_type:complete